MKLTIDDFSITAVKAMEGSLYAHVVGSCDISEWVYVGLESTQDVVQVTIEKIFETEDGTYCVLLNTNGPHETLLANVGAPRPFGQRIFAD